MATVMAPPTVMDLVGDLSADGLLRLILYELMQIRQALTGAGMAIDLTEIQNTVAQNTSLEGSATTLIQGLAQKLTDLANSTDPNNIQAALHELAVQLQTSATPLSAAIVANTPVQSVANLPPSTPNPQPGTVEQANATADQIQKQAAETGQPVSSQPQSGTPGTQSTMTSNPTAAPESGAGAA